MRNPSYQDENVRSSAVEILFKSVKSSDLSTALEVTVQYDGLRIFKLNNTLGLNSEFLAYNCCAGTQST